MCFSFPRPGIVTPSPFVKRATLFHACSLFTRLCPKLDERGTQYSSAKSLILYWKQIGHMAACAYADGMVEDEFETMAVTSSWMIILMHLMIITVNVAIVIIMVSWVLLVWIVLFDGLLWWAMQSPQGKGSHHARQTAHEGVDVSIHPNNPKWMISIDKICMTPSFHLLLQRRRFESGAFGVHVATIFQR